MINNNNNNNNNNNYNYNNEDGYDKLNPLKINIGGVEFVISYSVLINSKKLLLIYNDIFDENNINQEYIPFLDKDPYIFNKYILNYLRNNILDLQTEDYDKKNIILNDFLYFEVENFNYNDINFQDIEDNIINFKNQGNIIGNQALTPFITSFWVYDLFYKVDTNQIIKISGSPGLINFITGNSFNLNNIWNILFIKYEDDYPIRRNDFSTSVNVVSANEIRNYLYIRNLLYMYLLNEKDINIEIINIQNYYRTDLDIQYEQWVLSGNLNSLITTYNY